MSKLYNKVKKEVKKAYFTHKATKMLMNHSKPKKSVKQR